MKKALITLSLAAVALPTAPVMADPPPWAPAHGRRHHDMYDSRGRYVTPQVIRRGDRIWMGEDGRYHCRRSNGTTGLIVGAAVGALIGREVAGRRDKTTGIIIGAVGGGLLGRAIDRGEVRCR